LQKNQGSDQATLLTQKYGILMLSQMTSSPYFLAAVILLAFGIILIITGFVALIRARVGSFTVQTLLALLLLPSAVILGMIALGIQGYQTLTQEEIAAHISVSPIAHQRFAANIKYPDGRTDNFIIAGDEIYIDAHILKWQPLANLIGLHTAYELDRIGGRYRDIEQERAAERSVNSLSREKPVNLFQLRQLHTFLAPLLDAKYGSATFIPVTQPAELELRISTSGLLIRELLPTLKPN
jgi:hypothetical protein